MALDYLFTAANGMAHELYRSIGEPDGRNLAIAAAIGCNAMIEWSHDQDFREIVRDIAQRQRITATELSAPVTQAGDFGSSQTEIAAKLHDRVDEFLRFEMRILEAHGLSNDAAERVVYRLRNQIESLQSQTIYPTEIFEAIYEVREIACEEAYKAASQVRNRDRIERVFRTLCGGAIVVANGSNMAASMGLSAPLSVLSGALGSAIIRI